MQTTRVSSNYCVEITVPEMISILKKDEKNRNDLKPTLYTKLEEIDVISNVGYEGHYGAIIFYTLNQEDDKEQVHAQVRVVIKHYLNQEKHNEHF